MKQPDPLARLWALARQRPAPPPDTDAPLPPGLATRIAARWADTRPPLNRGALWETVSAAGLVTALALCGVAAWMREEPHPAREADFFTAILFAEPKHPAPAPLPF